MVIRPAGQVPVARAAAESPRVSPEDVRAVLRDDSMCLVAQPVIALESGSVTGYELLARFPGPPLAPPDVWFVAARRAGLATELTRAVVRRMHELRPTLPPNTFCSVNVEPDMLLDPGVMETLSGPGSLQRVVVELTEHVDVKPDQARVLAALDRLRELGASIAVDDAGTGYSGLAQLLHVRPDIVKVDRDLVTGLDRDPVRRTMVELIGALASRMDAWVLAEGVETTDELATLARLQVPLVQGFRLGRPVEPWSTLGAATTAGLRNVWDGADTEDDVMRLVHDCPTRLAGSGDLHADDVVVDELDRPLAVVVTQAQGEPVPVPAMTVAPSSAPVDVLRRAMTRPTHLRFAPVVCTDPRGALIGVIDPAELVETVITLDESSPDDSYHALRVIHDSEPEEARPMKRFRCGDIVPGCDATFTGTRDEILTAVADHARRDHGMTDIPDELVTQVEASIEHA